VKSILFIGGPLDGQNMDVDESALSVMWPIDDDATAIGIMTGSEKPKLSTIEEETVKYVRVEVGHNEIMFLDEGTPLLQKLVEGYKAS